MKFTMTKIAAVMVLSATAMSAQAVDNTLTFIDGLGTTSFAGTANTSGFTAGAEFRMVNPTGALGGGAPLNKSSINGGEAWNFSSTSNLMTSVSGTALVGTASGSSVCTTGGCPGLDQGALFFGGAFGFVAPIGGTETATFNLGGLSDNVANVGDTFSILMTSAEAHWNDSHFPLANVLFNGTITGVNGEFNMWAEHLITVAEDPTFAGFSGWTAQWNYDGVVGGNIAAVPEASTYGMMLAGLGLVGFAVRRRKLMA
jgi:hypothetical protein